MLIGLMLSLVGADDDAMKKSAKVPKLVAVICEEPARQSTEEALSDALLQLAYCIFKTRGVQLRGKA